jgi:uncharacterized protein YndB with AHSA1/START domain
MDTSKAQTTPSATDRIEKSIVLQAPRSEVWRALTDPAAFSAWFQVDLKGPFTPGTRVRGPITHPGYTHLTMDITIEQVEPERRFSWRWRPGSDPDIDPSEPTTLVVFELEGVPQGTRLTLTESGFDRIPVARRDKVYRENDQGWSGQMENIRQYLARTA